jgi:hypothetical protein
MTPQQQDAVGRRMAVENDVKRLARLEASKAKGAFK